MYARAISRHVGTLRTVWRTVKGALVTPTPETRDSWVMVGFVTLNPIEKLLAQTLPNAEQLLIKDTVPCEVLTILAAHGLTPPDRACNDEFKAAFAQLVDELRYGPTLDPPPLHDAGPVERRWMDLAVDAGSQARLWRWMIDQRITEPIAVFSYASSIDRAALDHRDQVLPLQLTSVGHRDEAPARLTQQLDGSGLPSAQSLVSRTNDLAASYESLPAEVRQAADFNSLLRSFLRDDILVPALRGRSRRIQLEEQLEIVTNLTEESTRVASDLLIEALR
jgi:hypothetical protein